MSECVAASWLLHCQMPVCDALKMENVKQALNTNTNYSPPSPAPQKNKNHHHSQRVLFSKRNLI